MTASSHFISMHMRGGGELCRSWGMYNRRYLQVSHRELWFLHLYVVFGWLSLVTIPLAVYIHCADINVRVKTDIDIDVRKSPPYTALISSYLCTHGRRIMCTHANLS